jgi:hypothetical protein
MMARSGRLVAQVFLSVVVVAAAALRWRAGAGVALCHTAMIMRSGLPVGDIDVNDLSVI